ncbi:solute carrier family 22 member 15-like [Littorina saxatilis]|uniref:Major facilitator superfamily (MFS) profile domain-containing protein n=1 Tax=Littorina saxatilis TaxID=31220 RepID=A0AAN9AL75_9CAEN
MAHNYIEIDPVLNALGPVGIFACLQCFLYFLGFIPDSYQLFSYVFTAQDVEHSCAALQPNANESLIPELSSDWLNSTTVLYDRCSIYLTSNISGDVITKDYPCLYGMQYEEPKETSIVSEFDLVCGRTPLAGLTHTVMGFGTGLGSFLFPWLSDLYGRKRVFLAAVSLGLALNLVNGFAPGYTMLVVCKFFLGFTQAGIGLVSVTAGVELFPSSKRALFSGFFGTLWWAMCIASLAPLAYLLRSYSWRTLQLALSWGPALVLVLAIFIKEPVRWLVANGKIDEAEEVLKQAARLNRKDPQSILHVFHSLSLHESEPPLLSVNGEKHPLPGETTAKEEEKQEPRSSLFEEGEGHLQKDWAGSVEILEEKLSFLDLLRHRLLRKNILLSVFIWFVDSLIYNALYLMSDQMALDLYTSFFLNSLVEGASCILMVFMLSRFGRKPTLVLFHVIAGIGLIASSVCSHYKDVSGVHITGTVVSLLGKMGIGGAFNTMFMFTPEIFPTNIRNRALGTSSACATLGMMISPYGNILADYAIWAPGAVFGACCALAVLCLLALPESKDRELPQTTHDVEMWYNDVTSTKKKYRCCERSGQEESVYD